jgi:hypothetical protein
MAGCGYVSVNSEGFDRAAIPVSDCLGVAPTNEPANWAVRALWPWWRGEFKVGSLVPSAYEAFVRVGHLDDEEGSLPQDVVRALVPILSCHAASDRVWFAIWEGWGTWGPGESFAAARTSPPMDREQDEVRSHLERIRSAMARVPAVRIPGRDYYLFVGPLRCAVSLEISGWYQSASMWWADDRSWFVATEVDARCTYIGGSRGCIDDVLALPELAVTEVRADDEIVWADPPPS